MMTRNDYHLLADMLGEGIAEHHTIKTLAGALSYTFAHSARHKNFDAVEWFKGIRESKRHTVARKKLRA